MDEYLDWTINLLDDAVVSALDEQSLWSARFGLLLLEHVPLRGDATVLDVGCGTGFPLFELAHMLGPAAQLVGVDIWQAALDRAAHKRAVYGLDNVALVAINGVTLPFAEAHFDLIVANLLLNNVERPLALLAECARVAKPAARLALTTNLEGHMQEFYAVFRQVLTDLGLTTYLERLAAHEQHRGTKDSVCHMVEAAGFQVVKIAEDACRLRYASGSAFFRHFLSKVGFLPGWRSVVDSSDARTVFAALEAALNAEAAATGQLAMTVPMLYLEATRS